MMIMMITKFLRDERGSYALMTAAAIVPIMGALALAVDYTEMSKQRQETLNALDAAGVATARIIAAGATDEDAKAYAKSFFEANLGSVEPVNTILTVVLPKNNVGGGGTLKLSAALKYKPYFFPTFASLIGKATADSDKLDFAASSEIRLKNSLEVALVLDNSGSMTETGKGSNKVRFDLLKDASKELVETLAKQAGQLQQVNKPVQFALVPFAASVNVGADKATATWMDQDGISPVHHENFDWSTFTASDKTVQLAGGVYYKKGTGWGAQADQKVTRFTMFADMKRITGSHQEQTGTTTQQQCGWSNWKWVCTNVVVPVYTTVTDYGPYASWTGCVESRPDPYNKDDTTPSTSTPATLFVPMFAPDEPGDKWATSSDQYPDDYGAYNNWWNDGTEDSSGANRQKYMPKYFDVAPQGTAAAAASGQTGPNGSCTTKAITPLTDVSNTTGKDAIKAAIDAMVADGATNVPEGMAWGWRAISHSAPFTEGRAESEKGNDKVLIVLTDGANTYYTPQSLGANDPAGNKSIYSNFGYAGKTTSGYSTTRIFQDTTVTKTDYSNSNYTKAMNQHFEELCTNAKGSGLIVMTVALDLDINNTTEKGQIDALKACASESRFRKNPSTGAPEKNFWNTTGGDLSTTFKAIADELSNLRIVG
jgi:Flp pilus assembly protein TadG